MTNAAMLSLERRNEHIDVNAALALWRRVLSQLIIDYFDDYPGAEEQVKGESLEYVCDFVGFDAKRTRQAIIKAKQEYLGSGKQLKHWLNKRHKKIVEISNRNSDDNPGGLLRLLHHNRLKKVCPDLAGRMERDQIDWNERSKRRMQARKAQIENENRRVKEFFREFWGKPDQEQSCKAQGGA